MFNFPSTFRLQDLVAITAPVFDLKANRFQKEADDATRKWFQSVYDENKLNQFLDVARFDLFAALAFPNADQVHLETCLAFFLWAFSTDDLSDEGELQARPQDVQAGVDISMSILYNPDAPRPQYPYAAMLHDILRRIRMTATSGTCYRFARAFEDWSRSQIKQAHNRSVSKMPSVEEFIIMRRATIGGAMVEAMIEYSMDIDLPYYVFKDPVIIGMSEAATDVLTWPNDLCSFNKEQADGDYQNLVCALMVERRVDLQTAIDLLTDMLSERVRDYANLKTKLPSFGREIDAQLVIYHKNLEHFVQGTIVWYYASARYFPNIDVSSRENLVIRLFSGTLLTPWDKWQGNQNLGNTVNVPTKTERQRPLA
ncbi:hypothetical protein EW146_g8788 [Bondarzewia mesenterica]|uniref:Terpene synthase n=1 Tax=Bondarzewia mesenterica TaxID=1095465 RepID=A0A4S4LH26_9AGAM|nr:hypothetical protein EW146_g8788 [Bondarzewia mesenterica]